MTTTTSDEVRRLRQANVKLREALDVAEAALSTTLRNRGYTFGTCTDRWAPEVRSEVAALAKVRATLEVTT